MKRKSDYLKEPIPKDGLELIWNKLIELVYVALAFNPYGGRMSEIPSIKILTWVLITIMVRQVTKKEELMPYGIKYFNGNFDRLVKIKTKVDPGNFFRNEQSIPTLPF